MKKYHLSNDGVVRPCSAVKEPCKLQHFENIAEGNKFYEESMKSEILSNPLKKNKKSIRKDNDYSSGEIGDIYSAEVAKAYRHYNTVKRHTHNSKIVPTENELTYYSTPAGRLELERRSKNSGDEKMKESFKIIDAKDFKPIDFTKEIDMDQIQEKIKIGEDKISHTLGENDEILRNFERDNDEDLRHYVIERSHEWIKKLSSEEQETLSYYTSDGFMIPQYYHGITSQESAKFYLDSILEQEETFYNPEWSDDDYAKEEERFEKSRMEYSKSFSDKIKETLKKAPVAEKPFVTYRGTNEHEIVELIGGKLDGDLSKEEINDLIQSQLKESKDRLIVNENSRISKIPASTSLQPQRAKSFGNFCVIEILQTTESSPANVSAWGPNEYEVLTNPWSKYEIVGSKILKDSDDSYGDDTLVVRLIEHRIE